MFAFILLSSFTNFREGEIPVTFILVAVLFIGQQVWDGITIRDNISHMTHIIGNDWRNDRVWIELQIAG